MPANGKKLVGYVNNQLNMIIHAKEGAMHYPCKKRTFETADLLRSKRNNTRCRNKKSKKRRTERSKSGDARYLRGGAGKKKV